MQEESAAAVGSGYTWVDRVKGRVPIEYQDDFIDRKIETNLTRTLMLSIFIISVQVFLNVLNIVKPNSGDGGGGDDIMKYVMMSLFTLVIGIVYLIICLVIRRGHLKNKTFRRFLPFSLLYLYCAIQMVFLSFNVSAEAGMNSYVIALILLGFFIIMSPLQNFISITALFLTAFGILAVFGGSGDIFSIIMDTDLWTNILIITLLIAFMSYATYNMYRDNFLNSKRLEVSNERLDQLAKTDSLTGLYNRWGFYEHSDQLWGDYLTRPGMASVFMFDIDYFKEYNDKYGHLAGDKSLRLVAQTIRESFTPDVDGIVCRFGGEEFLCLARVESRQQADDLAELTRKAVEEAGKHLSKGEGGVSVTISGGYAMVEEGISIELDELIASADRALYASKDGGRNQIHAAKEISARF